RLSGLPLTSSLLFLLAYSALAAEPEATVRLLEGDVVAGRLMELSASKIVMDAKGDSQSFPTAAVMWVGLPASPRGEAAGVWVDLVDGSRLAASSYATSRGTAHIELMTGQTVEMPTRAVRSVRFRQQTPELATQWREIVSSAATSDMIVIRKTSMRSVGQE